MRWFLWVSGEWKGSSALRLCFEKDILPYRRYTTVKILETRSIGRWQRVTFRFDASLSHSLRHLINPKAFTPKKDIEALVLGRQINIPSLGQHPIYPRTQNTQTCE